MRIPPRSSNHHAPTMAKYGSHVRDHCVRRREVNHGIHALQQLGGQRGAILIVFFVDNAHCVPALQRNIGDELARFSLAQNYKEHYRFTLSVASAAARAASRSATSKIAGSGFSKKALCNERT